MENKIVAEYIPCPTWMHDSERNIKQWLENPILRPSNRGTIFFLEEKVQIDPPPLAGYGGRL